MSSNTNMFANQAKQKEKEMAKVEEKAVQGAVSGRKERVTFALSISKEDLAKLRNAALKEDMPIAAYVHNLIKTIPED